MKTHFNKNFIMTEEEENKIQPGKTCQICEELIKKDDDKIGDHCHITGKFRGADHWSRNINVQLTKIVPAIFHNLKITMNKKRFKKKKTKIDAHR